MSTKDKLDFALMVLPYLLPVVSFLIGKAMSAIKVPAKIRALLKNPDVMRIVTETIEVAAKSKSLRTNEDRIDHVRKWARVEIQEQLGEWLPDSTINYLIEHVIVRKKAAE